MTYLPEVGARIIKPEAKTSAQTKRYLALEALGFDPSTTTVPVSALITAFEGGIDRFVDSQRESLIGKYYNLLETHEFIEATAKLCEDLDYAVLPGLERLTEMERSASTFVDGAMSPQYGDDGGWINFKELLEAHERVDVMLLKAEQILADLINNYREKPGLEPEEWSRFASKLQELTNFFTQSEDAESAEPGDYLEKALYSFKPGSKSGEEVALAAVRLAGGHPTPDDIDFSLVRVAQDLVDNDTRMTEGEEKL